MTNTTKIGVLLNNQVIDIEVTYSTTVLDVIKYIRKKYSLGIFESLELKYQGKILSPNSSVFIPSFSNGKTVFECNRRKLFGGI